MSAGVAQRRMLAQGRENKSTKRPEKFSSNNNLTPRRTVFAIPEPPQGEVKWSSGKLCRSTSMKISDPRNLTLIALVAKLNFHSQMARSRLQFAQTFMWGRPGHLLYIPLPLI